VIRKILEREIDIVDEELVVRISGLIGVGEIAMLDIKLTHGDINRRAIVLLFDLLAEANFPFTRRSRSRKAIYRRLCKADVCRC